MSAITAGIIGIILLLVMLGMGIHIALVLIVVGTLGLTYLVGWEIAVGYMTNAAFHYAVYDFVAAPVFIVLGILAAQGGLADDLVKASSAWLGRIRGSLGIGTIAGCTLFGTVCGSSLVTATVFARTMSPRMRQHGYDKGFAYGITTSGGIIGMLIPPSMLAVIYGLLTEESIGKLQIAGIGPGLLVAIIFSAGIVLMITITRRKREIAFGIAAKATWKERFVSLGRLWQVAVVGVLIIGGIYSGVFTVVEAATLGLVAMLVVLVAIRRLNWKLLRSVLLESMSITAMVFFLLVGARVFSRFLTLSTVSPALLNMIIEMDISSLQFMGIMIGVYLILGCFLDSVSMLSITLPVIYPVVTELGIHPIYFAMVAIVAIETGLITPPVGLNLFGVKAVAEPDVTFGDIVKGCVPFFAMMVVVVIILLFVPIISTFFVSLMSY